MQEQQTNTSPYANAETFRAHLTKVQQEAAKAESQQKQDEKINDNPPTEEAPVQEQTDLNANDKGSDANEAVPNTEDDQEPKKEKEPRLIPKSRLKQETEKRRIAEEQLMKEREDRIKFETELKMLREMQNKDAIPKETAPKPLEIEQIDALDQEAHQIYTKKIRELEQKLEQIASTTSQKTHALHVENIVKSQREEFEKSNPDFKEALEHLTSVEFNIAKNFYASEEEAKTAVNQKFANMVQNAVNTGKSVPELFYNIAKTYGYANKIATNPTNPGAPVVNLEAIKKNKEKSASISHLGNNISLGGPVKKDFDIRRCFRIDGNEKSGIDPSKFAAEKARVAKNVR